MRNWTQTWTKTIWLVALLVLLAACAPAAQIEEASVDGPPPIEESAGVDVRIAIEEGILNTLLGGQLVGDAVAGATAGTGVDVQLNDPTIDIAAPNLVNVTVGLNAAAFEGVEVGMRPTISLAVIADDEGLGVTLAGVILNGVEVPLDMIDPALAGVEATIRAQLASALELLTDQAGLSVQDVIATNDTLYLDMGR